MTIKDIAKESGYAVGTVSRVLNNHPDVSEKARKTIMAVVEKHHFKLNSNAKHLKQQGVKPGVPDLCLPVPRGQYHGLYIEMKTESGHTSDEQEWWGERLQAQGYVWRVCHGWQAAVAVLEWYLQL